jgi:hypothetical protein
MDRGNELCSVDQCFVSCSSALLRAGMISCSSHPCCHLLPCNAQVRELARQAGHLDVKIMLQSATGYKAFSRVPIPLDAESGKYPFAAPDLEPGKDMWVLLTKVLLWRALVMMGCMLSQGLTSLQQGNLRFKNLAAVAINKHTESMDHVPYCFSDCYSQGSAFKTSSTLVDAIRDSHVGNVVIHESCIHGYG